MSDEKMTAEKALGKIVKNTSDINYWIITLLIVLVVSFSFLLSVYIEPISYDLDEMEQIMIEYIEETEGLTWDNGELIPIQEEKERDCCE